VRVGVNCGFALTALLTRPAYDELQLAPGKPVTAVVKATAVHLIAR
jgi:molybdate transport system ATP-binding protein